ncbi:hypothetical protein Tco_0222514 [Tanacetum coccineum]
MGLWYPKVLGFELQLISAADHAVPDTRKSHFWRKKVSLGDTLVSLDFKEAGLTGKVISRRLNTGLTASSMTSDHNSSELEIHDHSNELSRSKLVPKVVPPADKTDTSRQELEILFHNHITMLRTLQSDTLSKFTMTMEIRSRVIITQHWR